MTSRRPSTSGVPRSFSMLERRHDLAAQAERLLVDDEEVGPVDVGGVADDPGAHLERMLDADPEVGRVVLAGVDLLDHARDAHEVDARAELVGADHRRARDDQHRDRLVGLDDGVGDGAAAAHMAETERVVAVDQHTLGPAAVRHASVSPLPKRLLPRPVHSAGLCHRSAGPREPPRAPTQNIECNQGTDRI